ncbi:zf-DHHC-domain-containing protein [Xylariaceae sp. FL1651]|nr:zf-DHHC-domain-containing protein [Xylariaceae sp. FL1651]
MAFLVGSTALRLQHLAVPFASILIAVLGYGSQWLFATSPDLAPGPLTPTQTWTFNLLLACLWWTYWRACTVDPGRYEFPRSSKKKDDDEKAVARKTGRGGDASISSSSEDEDDDSDNNEDNEGGNKENNTANARVQTSAAAAAARRRRWCRKCAAPKPPRAHHCKSCGRCIPKMDHHCPWTGNCVSLQTFPHFVRFVAYTNLSLWTLGYLLWQRFRALWESRHLPAYLGPTHNQLAALTALSFATGLTALALGILLVTTVRGWALNTTMIEGWEIERHEAVLERGGYGDDQEDWWHSGDGDADAAPRSMVDPVEFPYDIGVWANLAQAMGTTNLILWFLPFAGGPRVAPLPSNTTPEDLLARLSGVKARGGNLGTGWSYEENGLNDREGMWPPIDPDKVRNTRLWRQRRREENRYRQEQLQGLRNPAFPDMNLSPEEEKEAFRRRQELDLRRWQGTRAQILDELEEVPAPASYLYEREGEGDYDFVDEAYSHNRTGSGQTGMHGFMATAGAQRLRPPIIVSEGRSGWVNADGEQLRDYGVDEEAEFDDDYVVDESVGDVDVHYAQLPDPDDEEVPLAELVRRRKVRTKDGDNT